MTACECRSEADLLTLCEEHEQELERLLEWIERAKESA